ncbi:hypothetical protein GCM10010508_17280 [Streptomyces naganishii JCM 4654]|uniref:Uncharacterized protein n=1 Tax=Streptomyces naganishii JCM 4654 TaxID=1306179 RepID=A0A918Y1V8_9ACTN|nr:hypothetical protein GCM10010508_17280 [Streptomyces naganishii JCM 4654]
MILQTGGRGLRRGHRHLPNEAKRPAQSGLNTRSLRPGVVLLRGQNAEPGGVLGSGVPVQRVGGWM